ncbi:phosphonoacetaldehyde hydrolase [Roseibium denhamense]|uniref:Photosynthetic complex assembly protein n=1 Tax=Roseibium denhamense TaxID=76305 RepID=A0ABY1PKR7_9HYPH|nr:photosynthetic complex assembly protein PuhC [Roseibium denhamense]MTI07073.1 phosphonoacetaldehyde hydrolase [Roseibium denhamense]SMP36370.1 putative photosynthetic complex assembly protein [Roseibium denhamense]
MALAKQSQNSRPIFPKSFLLLVGALLIASVTIVVFNTSPGTHFQDRLALGEAVQEREIVISQKGMGVIDIFDAQTGAKIAVFNDKKGGFVRGAMPALKRLRLVNDVPQDEPYRLVQWESGGLTLEDTAVKKRFYLNAFGKDNAASFASLL